MLGIIAFDTPTGLGYQTRAYVKHLKPSKILEIDVPNGMPKMGWYPQAQKVGHPTDQELISFLDGLESVLIAETPLNYNIYKLARERGIKTVLVPNYEFFDYFVRPDLPKPDMIISPSMWHYGELREFCLSNNIELKYIHHPVDREEFRFRLRETGKVFHIAGKPAVYDRNGTWDFLKAYPSGRVITQDENFARELRNKFRLCDVFTNIENPSQMYMMGDLMVLPRRYGGNCLPLNEALSSGCPVIMPDISPNNEFLPKEWLVKATLRERFTPRTVIDIYSVDLRELRIKIDEIKADIKRHSELANELADTISWKTLKREYEQATKNNGGGGG